MPASWYARTDIECRECFERDDAYCFLVREPNRNSGQWTNCSPTEHECREWSDNLKPAHPGMCFRARPDEYLEEQARR
jgi:hypothetical protein